MCRSEESVQGLEVSPSAQLQATYIEHEPSASLPRTNACSCNLENRHATNTMDKATLLKTCSSPDTVFDADIAGIGVGSLRPFKARTLFADPLRLWRA